MAFAIKDVGNGGYPPPGGGTPPWGVYVPPGNSAAPEYLIWEFPLGFQVSRGYPGDFNEISLKTWKSTEIWPNPSGLAILTPISLISTLFDPPGGGPDPPRDQVFVNFHENSWKHANSGLKRLFYTILTKIAPRPPKISPKVGFRPIFEEFGNPKTLKKHP